MILEKLIKDLQQNNFNIRNNKLSFIDNKNCYLYFFEGKKYIFIQIGQIDLYGGYLYKVIDGEKYINKLLLDFDIIGYIKCYKNKKQYVYTIFRGG